MDGCTNYTVLSEADRAQGNVKPPHDGGDNSLLTGWYRFQGAAGDRMPDKCVFTYSCGVYYPGWFKCIAAVLSIQAGLMVHTRQSLKEW